MTRIQIISGVALLGAIACSNQSSIEPAPLAQLDTTEVRQLDAFSRVDNRSFATLTMTSNQEQPLHEVELRCDSGSTAAISTEVDKSGTLVIEGAGQLGCVVILSNKTPLDNITVTGDGQLVVSHADDVRSLDVHGDGQVVVGALAADDLRIDLRGAGEATLLDLEVGSLTLNVHGTGVTNASGRAASADLTMGGNAELSAGELIIDALRVDLDGTSQATIAATSRAAGSVRGDAYLNLLTADETEVNLRAADSALTVHVIRESEVE